ncbi:methionyl-tRNA formyltransferase [Alkalihalobacillus hemicellulosilyticus]|uniref:Methionyl-tRNA formyltransferase n=1 Tax=Halalkalibacter hemicellulosilyticusJCM 9152 TaxID=1236971 RepID=W4QBX7_9BACI|nr:methionyl-tRNA formyltransferase [Halalkalibacter hemicellulosilyticus]GAE29193.1 methionyl-tRNA formyltransferase [Halalkalibacter hemicellulosilyticusJCM 9152]
MKIVFMGTPDFAVPVLRSLVESNHEVVAVVTQPDRPVGRKKILTPPPVKVEALAHGISVLQPEKVKDMPEVEKVLEFEPDLIVTAAFGQILPKELLEYPTLGCINVHASLLPKYRGGAPIHQAIIDGEKEAGVTIMYMVEKLDAGDMLSYVKVPIEEHDHVGTLHDKLSKEGARLLLSTIPNIVSGKAKAIPQDESQVTFAHNITREMEKINWEQSGEEIYNHIRGLHPWPVAYTKLNDKGLKVWWGEKVSKQGNFEPGVIERIEEDGIIVATGNTTSIKITDLQPAGKKRMDGSAFIRGAGASLTVGMRVGDE